MPSIDTVDSIVIQASPERLFDTILDYPGLSSWYPPYHVSVIGGGEVAEGTRLQHELKAKGSPITSRFVRTVQKIERPKSIEETYDEGDLLGDGRWVFEPEGDGATKVSFYCRVRSNKLLMHIGFLIAGESGHNGVYQDLLAELKAKAEAEAA